jgi:hypothetical protein
LRHGCCRIAAETQEKIAQIVMACLKCGRPFNSTEKTELHTALVPDDIIEDTQTYVFLLFTEIARRLDPKNTGSDIDMVPTAFYIGRVVKLATFGKEDLITVSDICKGEVSTRLKCCADIRKKYDLFSVEHIATKLGGTHIAEQATEAEEPLQRNHDDLCSELLQYYTPSADEPEGEGHAASDDEADTASEDEDDTRSED